MDRQAGQVGTDGTDSGPRGEEVRLRPHCDPVHTCSECPVLSDHLSLSVILCLIPMDHLWGDVPHFLMLEPTRSCNPGAQSPEERQTSRTMDHRPTLWLVPSWSHWMLQAPCLCPPGAPHRSPAVWVPAAVCSDGI